MSDKQHTVTVRVDAELKQFVDRQPEPNSELIRDLLRGYRDGRNEKPDVGKELQLQRLKDEQEELQQQLDNVTSRLERAREVYDTKEDRRTAEVREWAETLAELSATVSNRDHPRLTQLADAHFGGDVDETATAVNKAAVRHFGSSDKVVDFR